MTRALRLLLLLLVMLLLGIGEENRILDEPKSQSLELKLASSKMLEALMSPWMMLHVLWRYCRA